MTIRSVATSRPLARLRRMTLLRIDLLWVPGLRVSGRRTGYWWVRPGARRRPGTGWSTRCRRDGTRRAGVSGTITPPGDQVTRSRDSGHKDEAEGSSRP
ncbi:MAG TPA: hypothetical protein VHJ83_06250 [Micromonosporaceae bacterium]|nr:hypothetical protein [Micromonosporaceae bacterium]